MTILRVEGLSKRYPAFCLRDVSFSIEEGRVMGLIGRNGAGKTTTIKSILRLVRPDGGTVQFLGKPLDLDASALRREAGYVSGDLCYYPRKRLSQLTAVTKSFYPSWDDKKYEALLHRFSLDETKRVCELSAGMKVKFALTLALSHRAELLLLDEPTSGLDPVSREELLEEFLRLSREEGVTILFSTHITSDLDRCADEILYLRKGRLAERGSREELVDRYRLMTAKEKPKNSLGACPTADGWTALYHTGDAPEGKPASLEDIMVHLEKGGEA